MAGGPIGAGYFSLPDRYWQAWSNSDSTSSRKKGRWPSWRSDGATDPQQAGARINLGLVQQKRGQAEAAEEAYGRAVRLNAGQCAGAFSLGQHPQTAHPLASTAAVLPRCHNPARLPPCEGAQAFVRPSSIPFDLGNRRLAPSPPRVCGRGDGGHSPRPDHITEIVNAIFRSVRSMPRKGPWTPHVLRFAVSSRL